MRLALITAFLPTALWGQGLVDDPEVQGFAACWAAQSLAATIMLRCPEAGCNEALDAFELRDDGCTVADLSAGRDGCRYFLSEGLCAAPEQLGQDMSDADWRAVFNLRRAAHAALATSIHDQFGYAPPIWSEAERRAWQMRAPMTPEDSAEVARRICAVYDRQIQDQGPLARFFAQPE